jgi:hypothetical protein
MVLLEVENIQDDFRIAIPQNDVPSDGDAFAIGWRRGKSALQFNGNKVHLSFQIRRKPVANHKFSFKARREAIFFGEAGWETSVMFAVPAPKFVAVMLRESVAAPIIIVVVLPVFTFVFPVTVAVVPAAILVVVSATILVVLVFICKSCVSWKHEKSENDDRKRFCSFQKFPPKWVGYDSRLTRGIGTLKAGRRRCFLGATTLLEAIWMPGIARISLHNPRECIGGPALPVKCGV